MTVHRSARTHGPIRPGWSADAVIEIKASSTCITGRTVCGRREKHSLSRSGQYQKCGVQICADGRVGVVSGQGGCESRPGSWLPSPLDPTDLGSPHGRSGADVYLS